MHFCETGATVRSFDEVDALHPACAFLKVVSIVQRCMAYAGLPQLASMPQHQVTQQLHFRKPTSTPGRCVQTTSSIISVFNSSALDQANFLLMNTLSLLLKHLYRTHLSHQRPTPLALNMRRRLHLPVAAMLPA